MIQINFDDQLAYDSRLEEYSLLDLTVTVGLNTGGSLTMILPPRHPSYEGFTAFKTIVTLLQDGELLFRGRVIQVLDDLLGRRQLVCEGERCFFLDAVSRPYDYQGTPAEIFASVLTAYNAQVQEEKRFRLGTITVTDPNDYIHMYTENAEQMSETVDKLVERCGGYVTFTTDTQGRRTINWLSELQYRSTQSITFGENLLDFSRGANVDLATRVLPYGAKDDETGERVTIESVNDGLDYIEDAEAVALRGIITRVVEWDDVTLPINLLHKAQSWLNANRLIVSSLTLNAVDLAGLGQDLDHFRVGDLVHVVSPPHGVDTWMLLEGMTLDLLDRARSQIQLGQARASLTDASVAAAHKASSTMQLIERTVRADYARDVAAAIEQTTTNLVSLVQQTSEAIQATVSATYATNGEVQQAISTQITQLSDSVTMQFSRLQALVNTNDTDTRAQFAEWVKYIRFEDGNIILGEQGNAITLKLENDILGFYSNGVRVAYLSNRMLYVLDGEFINSLKLGKFAFLPRQNGNLSFKKVVT